MHDEGDLIRRLMGSPALVSMLKGAEKEVAVQGYLDAIKALWLAAAGMATLTIFIQAATGWRGPKKGADEEEVESEETQGEQAVVVQDVGQPAAEPSHEHSNR